MAKAVKKALIVFAVLVMSVGILCACDKSNEYPQEKGKLYTLSEAYEQGLISRNDLLNIYFYYTGYELDGLEIIEKNPVELDEQTVQDMEETWVYQFERDRERLEDENERYMIEKYLGTYNGYVAFYLSSFWRPMGATVMEVEVDGITFSYP